jgi:hypothetical protein
MKWITTTLEKLRFGTLASAVSKATWFGITKRSSRPSEWYDAFYDVYDQFVVLHLKDERRIYGWVKLYPDLPTEGHLLVCDAEWLLDEPASEGSQKPPLVRILIDVTDVKFVEFVKAQPEENSNGRQPTTIVKNTDQSDGEKGRGESETSGSASTSTTSAASSKEHEQSKVKDS